MSSDHLSHVPSDAMPQGHPQGLFHAGRTEQPVALLTFAKLVLVLGALAIFAPLWVNLLGQWGSAPPPQSWFALRLLALGGMAGVVTLSLLVFKIWHRLLHQLPRTD